MHKHHRLATALPNPCVQADTSQMALVLVTAILVFVLSSLFEYFTSWVLDNARVVRSGFRKPMEHEFSSFDLSEVEEEVRPLPG